MLHEVSLDAIDEGVAGGALEHPGKVLHHFTICVHASEGLAVGIPPVPEEKPGRSVGVHPGRLSRYARTALEMPGTGRMVGPLAPVPDVDLPYAFGHHPRHAR